MIKVTEWDSIRTEYETTNISIRKLGLKHGVNYHTIKDKSFKQKWNKTKKIIQKELKEMSTKKTIENLSDKQAKTIENHFKISEALLYNIGKVLQNKEEFNIFVEKVKTGMSKEELKEFKFDSINDKKLLNVINSFEKIQKAQRQTLGILDLKDEKKLELDEKKIKIDEKLIEDSQEAIDNFLSATKSNKKDLEELFNEKE